jgi:hypothetical protein
MVELIPKQKPELPQWLNVTFYISLALLVAAIAGFFILNSVVSGKQATLQDLNAILVSKKTPENTALESEILNYERKFKDFSILIGNHLEVSDIFSLVEESRHPQVWFSQFTLTPEEKTANLSGKAQNFEVLGQQMLLLREKEFIEDVSLGSAAINKEGKIDFSLVLNLSEELLK